MLLLYQKWGFCHKFDSTKALGVCYLCVNIPQCGYMGHGLKLIMFYVQKHIAALGMCHNQALDRDTPLGATCETGLFYMPADVLAPEHAESVQGHLQEPWTGSSHHQVISSHGYAGKTYSSLPQRGIWIKGAIPELRNHKKCKYIFIFPWINSTRQGSNRLQWNG